MEELSYDTVSTVIESWELMRRRNKDYAETMGCGLLIKFFQERPGAKAILGFEIDRIDQYDSDSEESNHIEEEEEEDSLYKSEKFIEGGKNFVQFVDQAVDMLGPDLETLTQLFVDLGDKHHLTQYNLPSKFYPVLGRALLGQLEDMLGPKTFTIQTRSAWLQVFQAISLDLTQPSPSVETNTISTTAEQKTKLKSPSMFRKKLKFPRRNSNGGKSSVERRSSNESRKSNERRSSNESRKSSERRSSNESRKSSERRSSNESRSSRSSK